MFDFFSFFSPLPLFFTDFCFHIEVERKIGRNCLLLYLSGPFSTFTMVHSISDSNSISIFSLLSFTLLILSHLLFITFLKPKSLGKFFGHQVCVLLWGLKTMTIAIDNL